MRDILNLLAGAVLLTVAAAVGVWLRRQIRRAQGRRQRIQVEDALKHIHDCQYRGVTATGASLAGALGISQGRAVALVAATERMGLVLAHGGGLALTPLGRALALQIIRAHRIWERYMTDELGATLGDVHAMAEAREHDLSVPEVDALDARLGHPSHDPHGDPIPSAGGDLERADATPLTDWPWRKAACVVHIEDEPPAVCAQILSEGLIPGTDLEVVESDEHGLHLRTSSHECWLPHIVAAGVLVRAAAPEPPLLSLAMLSPGESATVAAVTTAGLARRRLMDLGLTPGVKVEAVMPSALGDPMAYRLRGSLIALRREQAAQVLIRNRERTARDPEPIGRRV
jgi:DtxR family Mn-dependent transcriptional regulator